MAMSIFPQNAHANALGQICWRCRSSFCQCLSYVGTTAAVHTVVGASGNENYNYWLAAQQQQQLNQQLQQQSLATIDAMCGTVTPVRLEKTRYKKKLLLLL